MNQCPNRGWINRCGELCCACYVADEEDVERALSESAGSGAADAQEGEAADDGPQKSAMERLVELGMAHMAQVPAACLEGEDPNAPLDRALRKVAALEQKPPPANPDAPDESGTKVLREVGGALSSMERAGAMLAPGGKHGADTGEAVEPEDLRARAARLILPTHCDRLANGFSSITWHAAMWPLFVYGEPPPEISCLPLHQCVQRS